MIHDIFFQDWTQVGLFVINTINLNCIPRTSFVQQVSKVQGGFVPVIDFCKQSEQFQNVVFNSLRPPHNAQHFE